MPGLVPGIHVFLAASKTWMAGTSPAMTSVYVAGTLTSLRRLSMRAGEAEQRIVVDGFDRREIAVRDVLRPRGRADVVGDRVQRQIDDLARVGRDVAGRAVHQVAVEHQHAAGLARGSDDAALRDQPRHGL